MPECSMLIEELESQDFIAVCEQRTARASSSELNRMYPSNVPSMSSNLGREAEAEVAPKMTMWLDSLSNLQSNKQLCNSHTLKSC
jgi:hypothetical protein